MFCYEARMNNLNAILIASVPIMLIMMSGLAAAGSFCINGKFTVDGTDGPYYNKICYMNGIVTLTNLPSSEEVSWRVNGDAGVGTVEAVSSLVESKTIPPKNGNLWCISLWAPSSPTHTIYSNSMPVLNDLRSKIRSLCSATEEVGFAKNHQQSTYVPTGRTDENPEDLWGLFKCEAKKVIALPEMKQIERDCIVKMAKMYCPEPIRDFFMVF